MKYFYLILLFCYSLTIAQNQTDKTFSKDSNTRLNPKIEFYRNQLPFNNANEFDASQLKNPELLTFPFALWSKGIFNKKKAKDYGTIVLNVTLPDTKQDYYYHFDRITGGCDIWINNKFVTSFGNFSKDVEQSSSKGTPLSLKLPKQKKITITVLISNNQHQWGGGINLKPRLYKEEAFLKFKQISTIKEFLAVIILLLLIGYQCFLYFMHKEKKYIYMALICLAFILRGSVIKNSIIYELFPNIPFYIIQKLRYASMYLACIGILLFYKEFLAKHINRKLFLFFIGIQSLGILSSIVLPTYELTLFAEAMRIFLIAQLIFIFCFIGIAIYKKETYAKLLLISIFIVLVCLVNNVLHATHKINTFFIVVYLPLIYLIVQSIINLYIQKDINRRIVLLSNQLGVKVKENQELKLETLSLIQEKKKIKSSLKDINFQSEEITSILALIQSKAKDDDKATLLKDEIANDLTNFTTKLQNAYPSLTKSDIEIAIFIVLGKTRQEIAELRGITISSAKTSRSRLRKKLELPKEVLLDDYLKSLL